MNNKSAESFKVAKDNNSNKIVKIKNRYSTIFHSHERMGKMSSWNMVTKNKCLFPFFFSFSFSLQYYLLSLSLPSFCSFVDLYSLQLFPSMTPHTQRIGITCKGFFVRCVLLNVVVLVLNVLVCCCCCNILSWIVVVVVVVRCSSCWLLSVFMSFFVICDSGAKVSNWM